MRPAWLVPYFIFSAGLSYGQSADAPAIRGVVTESFDKTAITGAVVTLSEFVLDSEKTLIRKAISTALTDLRGGFQFQPGHAGDYFLEVKLDGYLSPSLFSGLAEAPVSLSRDHPMQEVRLNLTRPGQLTGRVVDEDRKPIAGLRVAVGRIEGQTGLFTTNVVTDKDGSFTSPKMASGSYLIRVSPQHGDVEESTQFSEEDLKTVDQDLETSYWPGGSDLRSAAPVLVSPGASVDVGTIIARKAPYYRVHVSVVGDDCRNPGMWRFAAMNAAGLASAFDVTAAGIHYIGIPCGKEFLVKNLKPGPYSFALTNGGNGWALAPVEITSKNVDVTLSVTSAAVISGRVIAQQGSTLPPLSDIQVSLRPMEGFPAPGRTPAVDAEGRFLFNNVLWARHEVSISGFSPKYYVKEIRFNGVAAADGVISPGTGAQQLEIVMDDRPASLMGSVTDGDKPAGYAHIVIMKWPQTNASLFVNGFLPTAGKDGSFQLSGLAPGAYHVLAFPTGSKLPDAATLRSLMINAQSVTLERDGSQSVTLKLTDQTR